MVTKKIIKNVFKILLLIVLIFFSIHITNKVKEQFPSVEIESTQTQVFSSQSNISLIKGQNLNVNDFNQSELHYYCQNKYNNSLLGTQTLRIVGTSIRENDPILLKSDSKREKLDLVYFAGLHKDQLEPLEDGLKDLKLVYYEKSDIPIYFLICFNQEFRQGIKGHIGFSATKPSFVNNKWVSFVIFLTIFVLLSQSFEQITKIFKD